MEASLKERDDTLIKLEKQIPRVSNVFRECYLKKGRGALIVYTSLLNIGHKLSDIDYNTKSESLFLFDNKKSRKELSVLIDNYDPKSEGIMVLITESNANATWFVTVKLKSKSKR